MSVPTEVFNPHRTPIEILKRITVGRQDLIRQIHESLCLSSKDRNSPNWLIYGPRGMGKTHLLLILFDLVKTDHRTSKSWIILHQREEEYWRIYSTPTFLRSMVKQILENNSDLLPAETDKVEMIKALNELKGIVSGEEMFLKARAILEKFCRLTSRRIVIGTENLDTLFSQFKKIDIHQLRDFLQHNTNISLIGSSITTELGKDIHDHHNPFYRFFRLERLDRLSFEEQLQQIHQMAEVDDDKTRQGRVRRFLTLRKGSLKVIHHLSGGNPRLGVILYGVLAGPDLMVETVQLLHDLLDRNTPYFQDRMKDLSPMERPLAAAFCEAETSLTGAEAARLAGMDSNIAYSLLTRLERAGFIEPVESLSIDIKKGKLYQVSEDLFRMWWQYRFDSEKIVRKVVQFLAIVYEEKELNHIQETLNAWTKSKDEIRYLFAEVNLCKQYVLKATEFRRTPEFAKLMELTDMPVFLEREEGKTKAKEPIKSKVEIQKEFRRLKKAVMSSTAGIKEWQEFGSVCLEKDKFSEAERAFNRVIELDPKDAKVWFDLGEARFKQKNYKGAQEALENSINLSSNNKKPWHNLGITKLKQDDYKGAQEAFEKVLAINPTNAMAWFNLGVTKDNQGIYKEAQEAFEKTLSIDATIKCAWCKLGMVKDAQGDYKGAQEAIEKCLAINPNEAPIWFNLGTMKLKQEDYKGAQEAFERGLTIDPIESRAWFSLGSIKIEQEDYKGAQEGFEKGIFIDPNDAKAWSELGKAKFKQEDYKGAQEALERSLAINPNEAPNWFNLGTTKLKQEDYKGAQEAFERGLTIDPKKAKAWFSLGIIKLKQADSKGAQKAFKKGITLDPKDAKAWLALGLAKEELNDHEGAQEGFEKAIQLDKKNPHIWIHFVMNKNNLEGKVGLSAALSRLQSGHPRDLFSSDVEFSIAEMGLLNLQDAVDRFCRKAIKFNLKDKGWPELVQTITRAFLASVDIEDAKQLKDRIALLKKISSCRSELGSLSSLEFVFNYYLARLEPMLVPGGKKMTPKQRGEYIIARVPREQRQAIQDLVNKLKTSAITKSKIGGDSLKGVPSKPRKN